MHINYILYENILEKIMNDNFKNSLEQLRIMVAKNKDEDFLIESFDEFLESKCSNFKLHKNNTSNFNNKVYQKLYEYNSILSIIQRELIIEKVPVMELVNGICLRPDMAAYRHKDKTIFIADSYSQPDFCESLLVHELIHFFDFNNFPNVNRHEINLINNKIRNLVNFQIDANLFIKVYNEVKPINKGNYKQHVDIDLLNAIRIMYIQIFGTRLDRSLMYLLRHTNHELRAYIGQAKYCEEIGLFDPLTNLR